MALFSLSIGLTVVPPVKGYHVYKIAESPLLVTIPNI